MASALSNTSEAQNFTFLDSPTEIQTKIICDTDMKHVKQQKP